MNRLPVNARAQTAAAPARTPVVQRKLSVSVPGDKYEQEADRIADQVMRTESAPPSIQRICKECEEEQEVQRAVDDEEEEEETTLQGKFDVEDSRPRLSGQAGAPVLHDFGERLAASRASGTPLPEQTRAFFEPRFGRAFEDVRVHHGNDAASLAGSVRAKAFTVGRDIFFGLGEYAPQTERGRGLIAHELVHTVQQSGEPAVRREEGEEETTPEPEAGGGDAETDVIDPRPIDLPADISFGVGGGGGGTAETEPEEATISRATDTVLDDPEAAAASEQPYRSGMSPEALSDALGEGKPLDPDVRVSMESRYGRPLGGLRVHTDAAATSLNDEFGARAFAFRNHIAFGSGQFAPRTDAGTRLLRHEISHTLAPVAQAGSVFRACTTNCPPGTATPYSALGAGAPNCYGYALGRSGIINPGQIASTAEATTTFAAITNPASSSAALAAVLPYFTASHVKTNTEADIGSALSGDCSLCCFNKRKIIEVCADPATMYRPTFSGGSFALWFPMVNSTQMWDFHWYRKDKDRSWSHKRGTTASRQDDAAGTTPICNPCTASRSYSTNYNNVVGSWCV